MTYLSDKEQADLVKRFWNDYGRFIVLAIVAGLLLGFGWKWWKQRELNHQLAASALYAQYLSQNPKTAEGKKVASAILKKLQSDYPDSTYRAFAESFGAKLAIEEKNKPLALKRYDVIIQSGAAPSLKNLARVRQARVLISMKKPKQALTVLKQVTDQADMMNMLVAIEQAKAYFALKQPRKAMAAQAKARGLAKGVNLTLPAWLF